MSGYQSRQEGICRRVGTSQQNITFQQLHDFFNRKRVEVTAQYPDTSHLFKLEMIERGVWKHFFNNEPFPAPDSDLTDLAPVSATSNSSCVASNGVVSAHKDAQKKTSLFSPPSGPKLNLIMRRPPVTQGWVHDLYEGSTQEIKNKRATHTAGDRLHENRELPNARQSQVSRATGGGNIDSYRPALIPRGPSNKSPFSKADTSDLNISLTRAYVSRMDLLKDVGSKHGLKDEDMVSGYRMFLARAHQRLEGFRDEWKQYYVEACMWQKFFLESPRGTISRQFPADPPSCPWLIPQFEAERRNYPSYYCMEILMETKAIGLGRRSELFSYLNIVRTNIKIEHPKCDHQIRSFLADQKAWSKFFSSEPFPDAQPAEGHHPDCRAGHPGQLNTTIPLGNQKSNGSRSMDAYSSFWETKSERDFNVSRRTQGAGHSQTRMPKVATMPAHTSQRSQQMYGFTAALPHTHQSRTRANKALVTTLPSNSGDSRPQVAVAAKHGFGGLQATAGVVPSAVKSEAVDMDIEMSLAPVGAMNGAEDLNTNMALADMEIGTYQPQSATSERTKYKSAFGVSDLDYMLMEGAVKAEGNLRMVLDEEKGEVVTLGELLKRIASRSRGALLRAATERIEKRKRESAEEDGEDKRMRYA